MRSKCLVTVMKRLVPQDPVASTDELRMKIKDAAVKKAYGVASKMNVLVLLTDVSRRCGSSVTNYKHSPEPQQPLTPPPIAR